MENTSNSTAIDYSMHCFIKTFERVDNLFYATFSEEALPKNGNLEFTGRWHVSMLHPQQGLVNFYLKPKGNAGWQPDINVKQASDWKIEDELISWCEEQIQERWKTLA